MILTDIKNTKVNLLKSVMLLLILVSFSCKKKDVIQEDPYKGGKESLGVKFIGDEPDPNQGAPGDEVTFKVNGLAKYKDKFEFLINETKADVISFSDSTLTVKIPASASTGGTTLLLEGQSFFGPKFTVQGKVSIDAAFKAVNGANSTVSDILAIPNGYLLVGTFTNFESQAPAIPVNRIVSMNNDGSFQSLLSKDGANASILSINTMSNGKYAITGAFNNFNKRAGMNAVTILNSNGSLDTTIVQVINPNSEHPQLGYDTVAAFNGGVVGSVTKSFVRDNKITVLGNFQYFARYYYPRSTRDFKVTDLTRMPQIARLKENGEMDSTFNYDVTTKQGYAGTNGPINDAFMQADGKIVAVGTFSTFNGIQSNNIVRLNSDGSLDPTFATGTGADGPITSITYNAVAGRIMLAGNFKNFNGKAYNGIVMLNANGSVDETFKFGLLAGGIPNYAAQLNNGKIIVSGGFNNYNGVIRQGFMILNQDGSLAVGYNNTGAFEGRIAKMVQTTSALGYPAVLLVGDFTKFDNKKVGNIVRVEIKP